MRSTSRDAGRRAYLGIVRGVVMKTDDTKMIQTVDARGLHEEYFTDVERLQQYGFKSVPVDPDENGAKAAEVVLGFVNGNRSHPLVLADGDARTNPKNWENGDTGLWHHKGATAKLTATGWKHDAGADKQPHTVTVGNCTAIWADGKAMVRVGSPRDPAVVVKQDALYLGGDPDVLGYENFFPVETTGGPSLKVKAYVGS